jgi:hypothetical protein
VHCKPNEDIPVYEVHRERDGLSKTLHRNMLLPITTLPIEYPEKRIRKTSKTKTPSGMETTSITGEGDKETEDCEDEETLYIDTDSSGEDLEEESDREQQPDLEQESDQSFDHDAEDLAEETVPDTEEPAVAAEPDAEELAVEAEPDAEEPAVETEPDAEERAVEAESDTELAVGPEPDEEEPAVDTEDEELLIPRRSARTSKPPQRFADYVMQHNISTTKPKPAPRTKTYIHMGSTNTKHKPTPAPRKTKQMLLSTVLGIQEEQCKLQNVILNLLQET